MKRRGFDLDPSCCLYLLFYKMGAEAPVIYDYSGNSRNATITGAVPSSIPMIMDVEKVTNGDFASDTAWTKGTGWAIGNAVTAVAIVAGGTGYTAGDDLTVVGGTGTAATLDVTTVNLGVITAVTVLTTGAYTVDPTNPVSVTGGTGGNDATFNLTLSSAVGIKLAGTAADLEQDVSVTANNVYQIIYTITRTAGTLTPQIGGANGTARSAAGTYTEYISALTTGNLKFQADAAYAGTVDNVSVKKVTHYRSGCGWYCDGSNDLFTITDFLDTGNSGQEITVLQWLYPHAFVTDKRTFAHHDYGAGQRAWNINIGNSSGQYRVFVSDNGSNDALHRKYYYSSVNMTSSKFNLVGFTFNAGTLSLYLNGTVDPNPTKTNDDVITTVHNSTANITIGCYLNNGVAESFSNITSGEAWIFTRNYTALEHRNIYELTRRKYSV